MNTTIGPTHKGSTRPPIGGFLQPLKPIIAVGEMASPLTIWAVLDLKEPLLLLNYSERQGSRAALSAFLPEPTAPLLDLIGEHVVEYPGPLQLLPMTAEERDVATASPGAPVRVCIHQMPGVVD